MEEYVISVGEVLTAVTSQTGSNVVETLTKPGPAIPLQKSQHLLRRKDPRPQNTAAKPVEDVTNSGC